MFSVVIRTTVLYFFIVFILRFMGKRQIGELQPSELVTTILISNIASIPIENSGVPMLYGLLPILLLASFEVVLSALTVKSSKARKFIEGNSRVIIKDGIIDQKELLNLRFSLDDLLEQLRLMGIFNVDEVGYAVIETNGKMSVYQKFAARTPTSAELGLAPPTVDTPHVTVISDGTLDQNALDYCGRSVEWLQNIMVREGVESVSEVFLLSCRQNGEYTLIKKQ